MNSKVKIAVVGPGLIGKKHINLINQNSNLSLSSIIAPSREKNIQIAKQYNVDFYNSLEECFNKNKPDGVIISSPNDYHFEQAKFCINLDVPVLIEKPITSSLNEGIELVDLVKKNNSKVLIGHHRAHSPLMAKARQIISENKLGKLVTVMGSAQFYKPKQYFEDGPWRKEIGGGPILINLIHEIGNLRSLCGEIEYVQAMSSSSTRKFIVEDTVAINFRFVNGVLGTFILSDTAATAKSWEQTSQENPDYSSYTDEDCYVIAGSKGSLSIPTMRIKYYSDNTEPSWWNKFSSEEFHVEREDPLKCQLEHFYKMIKYDEIPLVSASDGLKNLQITDAIKKSTKTGRVIKIN